MNITLELQNSGLLQFTKTTKKWLKFHYATPDAVNTYRDRFFGCQQREGESIDDYFKRFREARNTLDTPLEEIYVVYLFIRHLLPGYRTEIRKDKNFATYKGITLDDVNDQLKRLSGNITSQLRHENYASGMTRFRQESHTNSNLPTQTNNNRQFSNKQRKTESSSRQPAQPAPVPLSEGTARFVQDQVRRGGGNQFFDYVQKHPRWKAEATRMNLCYKCGSKLHHARNCKAPPPPP